MQEIRVTYETACLAKEAGFDEICHYHFGSDGIAFESRNPVGSKNSQWEKCITRPTLAFVQHWLIEAYNIAVISCFNDNAAQEYYYFIHTNTMKAYSNRICSLPNKFKTYEGALENGLVEALRMVKTMKNKEKEDSSKIST